MGNKQTRASRTCRSQQQFEPDSPQTRAHDRRRSGRVQSTGTAIIHGSFAAHARILDLASAGLHVLLDDPARVPDVGVHVHVDVRLDGLGRWLHLLGCIARVEPMGPDTALVIEILVVPADFEDLVQDELLSALECARVPQVLLVDGAGGRRELVAAAFRATGCHVIEVGSPLEAIAAIDQSGLYLSAVVFGDAKLASQANELRAFLSEAYPDVPLVDVGQHVLPRTPHLRTNPHDAWSRELW